jgi:enoyl-CoA hydratase/carnithine racemase
VREGDLRELLLTGEPIDSARAQQIGLVQRVVPAERLSKEACCVARAILAGGPQTIRHTKAFVNMLYSQAGDSHDQNLVAMHLDARKSEEAREGLAAFAEKRRPNWLATENQHEE